MYRLVGASSPHAPIISAAAHNLLALAVFDCYIILFCFLRLEVLGAATFGSFLAIALLFASQIALSISQPGLSSALLFFLSFSASFWRVINLIISRVVCGGKVLEGPARSIYGLGKICTRGGWRIGRRDSAGILLVDVEGSWESDMDFFVLSKMCKLEPSSSEVVASPSVFCFLLK